MHKIIVEYSKNEGLVIIKNEGDFAPSANQASKIISFMKKNNLNRATFKIAKDGKIIKFIKGDKMAQRKELSIENIIKIYLDATAGKSLSEIAKEYGVSVSTVRRIKNKELPKYKEAIEAYFKALEKQDEEKVEKTANEKYFEFIIPDEATAKALAQLPEITATLPNGMKVIIIVEA